MFRILPWLRSDDASQKASKWTVDEVRSSRPLQRVWNGERDLSVGFGTACSRERTRCRVTTVPETQSLSSDAFLPGVAGWIGAPPGPRRVPAVRVPTVGVRHPARRPALEEQGGPAGGASVRLATTHLRRLLGKFLFQPSCLLEREPKIFPRPPHYRCIHQLHWNVRTLVLRLKHMMSIER